MPWFYLSLASLEQCAKKKRQVAVVWELQDLHWSVPAPIKAHPSPSLHVARERTHTLTHIWISVSGGRKNVVKVWGVGLLNTSKVVGANEKCLGEGDRKRRDGTGPTKKDPDAREGPAPQILSARPTRGTHNNPTGRIEAGKWRQWGSRASWES